MPQRPKTTDLNRALAAVSNPPKPKKKGPYKNKPKKLPQKPRSKKSKNGARKVKETTNLTLITKAIIHEGGTVPDIGVILGCAELCGEDWLAELKAQNLSVSEFLEIAKTRADIDLIRVAVKAATGYSWVDTEEELEPEVNAEGAETGKFKVVKKRRKPKHQSADSTMLLRLLSSRMPEYFMDRKEIKIDKRVVEIREDARAEITGFCSGLIKSLSGEVIEAEFVEAVG